MIIVTDSPEFSKSYFATEDTVNKHGTPFYREAEQTFLKGDIYSYNSDISFWKYAYITEFAEDSQFDQILRLCGNRTALSNNTICIAGSGKKFHGFRNRHWESHVGNIHLSCYFKPFAKASDIGLGFTMLAAVSVIDTLNYLSKLRNMAQIKWVNDIIVNNAKICGVIAQTVIQGDKITDAVIGVGLNVESVPVIHPTSFVPAATSINSVTGENFTAGEINLLLLEHIELNYKLLISHGVKAILKKYNDYSMVIGRNIEVWSDPHVGKPDLINKGKVERIGDFLEIYLENQVKPVSDGRIIIL
ncbi:MAG: biotin--[acetyl-CoA-carboxylase] ligase [Candidatus Kapaibacterium sp.]